MPSGIAPWMPFEMLLLATFSAVSAFAAAFATACGCTVSNVSAPVAEGQSMAAGVSITSGARCEARNMANACFN